jgi:hypothetical protein
VARAQRQRAALDAKPVKSRVRSRACRLLAMPAMRAAVLSVALAACAYSPGSFSHFRQDFPGQRTTVGCIDISVERRPDLTGGGTVLAYEFGNRCDGPAPIDFTQAKVLARTFDGEDLTLVPFDPDYQIMPLKIDGRTTGKEAIAYPTDKQLAEVCVDVAALTHQTPARWLCFASNRPPALEVERPEIAEVTP